MQTNMPMIKKGPSHNKARNCSQTSRRREGPKFGSGASFQFTSSPHSGSASINSLVMRRQRSGRKSWRLRSRLSCSSWRTSSASASRASSGPPPPLAPPPAAISPSSSMVSSWPNATSPPPLPPAPIPAPAPTPAVPPAAAVPSMETETGSVANCRVATCSLCSSSDARAVIGPCSASRASSSSRPATLDQADLASMMTGAKR
mmetsp:Transcript_74557/g.242052  ORF Transcript_74557/g.242052 Transcript_74557/m.242052 type:complete len:203 (-) Transcript_74557:3195-3803(-)